MLAKAASCFANASGGTIILGVRDNVRGSNAICGTSYDVDWCRQTIHELVTPSLLSNVTSLTFDGVYLLRIDIPPGVEVHEADGRFHRRVGKSCERMSASDIARLDEQRRQTDWSASSSRLSSTALRRGAVSMFREQISRIRTGELDMLPANDRDLLIEFGMTAADDVHLTNAAAVLVGRSTDHWPRIRYSYRATSGTEPQYTATIHAPLLEALRESLTQIVTRADVLLMNLQDGTQLRIADFPDGAVREAIANALLHSDYRANGSITIEHTGDSLRINSPGLLPSGVTPTNILTHASRPRNGSLFRIAEMIRIAEERGLGVDRMYRDCLRAGHPVPSIIEEGDQTVVVFTRGARHRALIRFLTELPREERESVETLLTVQSLLTRKTLNAERLATIIQKTPIEAENVLSRLADRPSGLVEPSRGTRTHRRPQYRLTAASLRALGSAVAYNKPPIDDITRKVVAHVDEYGRISNKTLRNLLDVDVYKARNILKRLVADGAVTRISAQARGPRVEYGPGPEFRSMRDRTQ